MEDGRARLTSRELDREAHRRARERRSAHARFRRLAWRCLRCVLLGVFGLYALMVATEVFTICSGLRSGIDSGSAIDPFESDRRFWRTWRLCLCGVCAGVEIVGIAILVRRRRGRLVAATKATTDSHGDGR